VVGGGGQCKKDHLLGRGGAPKPAGDLDEGAWESLHRRSDDEKSHSQFHWKSRYTIVRTGDRMSGGVGYVVDVE